MSWHRTVYYTVSLYIWMWLEILCDFVLLCFVFGQDHMSLMLVMISLSFCYGFPISGMTGTTKPSFLISNVYICVLALVFLRTTLKVSLNKPRCYWSACPWAHLLCTHIITHTHTHHSWQLHLILALLRSQQSTIQIYA